MFEVLALLEQLESTYATWMEAEVFDLQKKTIGWGSGWSEDLVLGVQEVT